MRCCATKTAILAVVLCVALWAQDFSQHRPPSVKMAPAGVTSVTRGKPGNVTLHFEVESGYHVNSNTPTAEFLIPTTHGHRDRQDHLSQRPGDELRVRTG